MHVLGMPPAFVLSQDQTLRLTSGLQPQDSSRHPRTGKTRHQDPVTSRALVRKTQTPIQSPRSLQSPAQDPNPSSRNTQATGPQPDLITSQRPPPAHPFSFHYNVKQRHPSIGRTKSQDPRTGLGDPLRPVGAGRQSKERCRNLHGPAFAGGCRLATAEGPI